VNRKEKRKNELMRKGSQKIVSREKEEERKKER
jgi:hypothetical protein